MDNYYGNRIPGGFEQYYRILDYERRIRAILVSVENA